MRPAPTCCSGLPVPSVGQLLAHQVGHDLQEVLQVAVGQELPAHGLVRGQPHLLGPLGEEQQVGAGLIPLGPEDQSQCGSPPRRR